VKEVLPNKTSFLVRIAQQRFDLIYNQLTGYDICHSIIGFGKKIGLDI
jgi:hypothetical protein